MTTRERFIRMFQHKEADHVPMMEDAWMTTIERWHREGMPEGMAWWDYFGIDRFQYLQGDVSAQYPHGIIEETGQYKIVTTEWGVTYREWKHIPHIHEYLDFTLKGSDNWAAFKARCYPSRDRIDWTIIERDYKTWRKNGHFILGYAFFGFDVTHSQVMGTEPMLCAMALEPEWCREMFEYQLDTALAMLDMIWDAGYTFDALKWSDDMGFNKGTFFSLTTYREVLKPVQQRAIDWAHKKGIYTLLHSCGNINAFLPDLIDMGLDGLNPMEVKAGMDPYAIKAQYGDKLLLHGGLNATLFGDAEQSEVEIRKLVPALMQNGGYLFASDHSIPNSVSLETMKRIVEVYKEVSAY